jgi:hypothetical protein
MKTKGKQSKVVGPLHFPLPLEVFGQSLGRNTITRWM